MRLTPCAIALVPGAAAFFTGNLNYFSPSLHHPDLGISIRKVAARTYANPPWDPQQLNFTHGVASGDPYDDSVILWTRVAPLNMTDNDRSNATVSGYVELFSHETEAYVQASKAPVCLNWKIATDKTVSQVVNSGSAYTSSDVDFTVKVGRARNTVLACGNQNLT
jgi:alkaline phosphatase D